MYTSEVLEQVAQDIDYWIKNFVEESNEFYHNQFPVCPYARSARLKNESIVHVYPGGGAKKFMREKINWLINDEQHFVSLMVFPSRVQYYPGIHRFIRSLSIETIPQDYFSLGGPAPHTVCAYPGLFNGGNYFVVGTNKLSKVLPAVETLKAKGYYKDWSAEHFKAIVETRQKLYEKYHK